MLMGFLTCLFVLKTQDANTSQKSRRETVLQNDCIRVYKQALLSIVGITRESCSVIVR